MIDVAQDTLNTVFLAGDEAGLYLQATTCQVWSPVGQTPIVRADPGRAKTNFYGALNLHNGQELPMRSDLMNAKVSAQYSEMILEANLEVMSFLSCYFIDHVPDKWMEL